MGTKPRDIDDAATYQKLSDVLHGTHEKPPKPVRPRSYKPTPEYREYIREYRRQRRAEGLEPMNYGRH